MRKLADITPRSRIKRHSVRHRLLAIALLPMLVILPLLLGISIDRWNCKFDAALISKVNDDLTIAHQYLARIEENTQEHLVSVTDSARFQEILRKHDFKNGDFASMLIDIAQKRGFDFLYVVDDDGRVVTSEYPMVSGLVRWNWPAITSALEGGSKTAIDVFEPAELSAISPELAHRAQIEILPTVGSTPTTRVEEARGLVLQSASALRLPDGRRAALVGGVLLTRILLSSIRSMTSSIMAKVCRRAAGGRRHCSLTMFASAPMCVCSRLNGPSERASRRRYGKPCWSRVVLGLIAPSSSMIGTSRDMNRSSIAIIVASACSMRAFSRNPSRKQSVRH
jgi:hypothetical protein